MKTCNKCNISKQDTDFHNSQLKKTYSLCKECMYKYHKEYYIKNKDILKEKSKIHYINNKEHYKNRHSEYAIKNKDKIAENKKKYQEKTQYNKKYREKNKEILKIKKREYIRNLYENNIEFKLRILISGSINKSLKNRNVSKNKESISNYLTYSFNDLINHLESLFESWMTWENHGIYNNKTWDDNDQSTWTWQIDHIIPHSSFKYTSMKDEEFKKCWSLENLRPLSAKENWLNGMKLKKH